MNSIRAPEQVASDDYGQSAHASSIPDQAQFLIRALDAAGAAIFISEITVDGPRHIYVNPACESITGYSADEFLGHPFGVLRDHEDDRHIIANIEAAIRDGRPYEAIRRSYRKDGTLFWNEVALRPMHDDDGAVTHYITVLTDKTVLKDTQDRLAHSEAIFRDAQQVAKVGCWEWDLKRNSYYRSPELWRLLGMDPDTDGGSFEDFLAVVHPSDRQRVERTVKNAVAARTPYDVIFRIVDHGNGEKWMHSRAAVAYDDDGKAVRLFGTGLDITNLKQTELRLARTLQDLEQSNKELEQFAFIASHDLQEPLRKIQLFGDRLQDRFADILPPDACDYLMRMRDGATRMRALIDDLLTLSRITGSDSPFEDVDLAELTAEVVGSLEMQIADAGAKLTIGDLPTVQAIPSQIRQLMQNLISNALKFRRPDVAPFVSIQGSLCDLSEVGTEAEPFAGSCEISVSDNGIGFEPAHGKKIFDLFQRLHSRSEYTGTGLGLAICRRIVDRHCGRIVAEGVPGRGATFRITLPQYQTVSPSLYRIDRPPR